MNLLGSRPVRRTAYAMNMDDTDVIAAYVTSHDTHRAIHGAVRRRYSPSDQ